MPFKIITCCNRIPIEDYYCIPQFVKSLGSDADKLLVLSEENMGTRWDGLGTKVKWVYKAIKEGKVKEKYIIFCDCWDLVFAVPPRELLSQYLMNFSSPLVISTEKNCFPIDLINRYRNLPSALVSQYRYLNSGMIVGETEALCETLEAMNLEDVPDDYRRDDGSMEHVNDQFLWQQIYLKQPVRIQLDYRQILCNTLHSVDIADLYFDEYGIRNTVTDTYPCIFHFNGDAKTKGLREPILKHLNL